jgi:Ser/Thr protein kinase RdoA (MazF antagonist)
MIQGVLAAYGLKEEKVKIEPYGSGLINCTWKVTSSDKEYILQKVNHQVFTEPAHIAHNYRLIAGYLKQHHPGYPFVAPLTSNSGDELICSSSEGYFRLFPFIHGSHSKEVVQTPQQAYQAARQFGRFTRLLSGLDVAQLKVTIPFFHDLELRYQQFLLSLEKGNKERIKASRNLIKTMSAYAEIVEQYQAIKSDPSFRVRVIHHDTKISNVLFDSNDDGICVIDLDTVMPGYFISDVGDMMRTYLSPVSEEEQDFSKIEVREEFYRAVVGGYYSEMKEELTGPEKQSFLYAGKFMIYMQALRFLTDYLNDDVYYGARYEGHNLMRARNQVVLLEQLMRKENVLMDSIGF